MIAVLDANVLYEAVERVSLLARDGEYNIIKIKFTPESLELAGNNPDAGSATESLEIAPEGEPMEIAFNAKYLLDITSRLSGDDAIFLLADAGSPTLVRDTAGDDALYVLMPMRV